MKLISIYEEILKKKNDAAGKISNIEPVESIVELLELNYDLTDIRFEMV